ncbi:MAG: hypothetical protein DWB56_07905 [Candidatus Jettenia sp.]|uniref:DUF8076 domain-containing protein n=1 Tax=Candidatus Jettenia caeni TaxID=247490 RepID=I3IJC0_9BACT|nr:hypothetical protein [Candidatus Jettenia sp. AMX1]MBC6928869.1 hypothetical protein [Candidatus Jettenia sp.]GAB61815.1 conserved hypothetical protein [Candidatus Jettenia caeni]KAA0250885.1 MAG: hypothetical protein EDM77_03505 [Candidatus Jettenia sp. AMX1]MCE7879871.1 hypothetical protein [Candidatus Jettenia sp. AMX1]MCQ3926650.1 hypothetical protein [Candidatus Jettenia sp.]
MPGYEIVEHKYLKPYREDGIGPNEIKIGFLDFLREIKNYPDGISPRSSFLVYGIEEVLYMTKYEDRLPIAREIHKILQSAASTLTRKLIQVQIVCKGRLVRGESLWLEYRGENLPIDLIFGSTAINNVRGANIYTTSFNLSS